MIPARDIEALRRAIRDPEVIRSQSFSMLRRLSILAADPETEDDARDLLLRLLEHRQDLEAYTPVMNDLLRSLGLYPFLSPHDLSTGATIAYELHRPTGLEEAVVFHRAQAEVYWELMAGRNVILSAPTSFGKSFVIDAMIASGKYRHIAIIVPTLALIDETRRRLLTKFRTEYKIITHHSQEPGDKNIFILTQERALDREDIDLVEFFVIDEFYKLSPDRDGDEDRSTALNQAFYRLLRGGAQFYLLGPSIERIPEGFPRRYKATWIKTDFKTVVSEVESLPETEDDLEQLVELCRRLSEPTLIFCRSPSSATQVVKKLIGAGVTEPTSASSLVDAADWASQEFHPKWQLVRGLQRSIGLHHGKVPRALAQFQVRAFNENQIRFLVCTSTLIEGVNTAAKNVIIFDNKVARKKFDYFTFNNIKGRSGRMFKHSVGRVYLFHAPPKEKGATVDIPLYTQDEDAPLELLMQLEDDDLTAASRDRLAEFRDHPLLSEELLRQNTRISPQDQCELAEAIKQNAAAWHRELSWRRTPTYDQLVFACDLIWRYLLKDPKKRYGVKSPAQLAFIINQIKNDPDPRPIIQRKIENQQYPVTIDEAIEQTLDEMRRWASFLFPQTLLVLHRIQGAVFDKVGLTPGDYRYYATSLENSNLAPALGALEEYGIPIQLAAKLRRMVREDDSLDALLERLSHVDPDRLPIHPFERRLLREAQEFF